MEKVLDKMNEKFNIIYADPPWKSKNAVTGGSLASGAATNYFVMPTTEICALDVRSIAAKDCWLFMWWLASMPMDALKVVQSWGFELKTMTAFSWIKKTVNGKDAFGMGFHTRQQQEQCLLAHRGSCGVQIEEQTEHCLIAKKGKATVESHSVRQNVYAAVREHSRKPDEVRNSIVELCGTKPRVELFATEKAGGWKAWGKSIKDENENILPSDIELGSVDCSDFLKKIK